MAEDNIAGLMDIQRALGRIEGRLDSQDQILIELKRGHATLVESARHVEQLGDRFALHMVDDAKLALQVKAIADRPAARRRAVVKWVSGAAVSILAVSFGAILKGCVGK